MTHGFDDQGRQFDADGNLRGLVDARGRKRSSRRAPTAGRTQYDGYVADRHAARQRQAHAGREHRRPRRPDDRLRRAAEAALEGKPRAARSTASRPSSASSCRFAQVWRENVPPRGAAAAGQHRPALAGRTGACNGPLVEHARVRAGVRLQGRRRRWCAPPRCARRSGSHAVCAGAPLARAARRVAPARNARAGRVAGRVLALHGGRARSPDPGLPRGFVSRPPLRPDPARLDEHAHGRARRLRLAARGLRRRAVPGRDPPPPHARLADGRGANPPCRRRVDRQRHGLRAAPGPREPRRVRGLAGRQPGAVGPGEQSGADRARSGARHRVRLERGRTGRGVRRAQAAGPVRQRAVAERGVLARQRERRRRAVGVAHRTVRGRAARPDPVLPRRGIDRDARRARRRRARRSSTRTGACAMRCERRATRFSTPR